MFSQENYIKFLTYAALAHGEQKTSEGLSFITHIVSVAMEVINACEQSKLEETKSDFAISCALLHAIIEDTNVTYDDLYVKFGYEIADAVEALSKNPNLSKQEQVRDSLERMLTQPYEVQMVKLADRITNFSTLPKNLDNEKIKEYYKESSLILSCFKNCNIYLAKRLEEKMKDYKKFIKE